jgi:RNA polymerase sigma-70 factor (ECF subfamily)
MEFLNLSGGQGRQILNQEEDHIITDIRNGREEAFRMLFEDYYKRLVVFAGKYLDNMESARDIVQDLFMNLYESRTSLTIKTSLKSYLYSSVKHRCLNQLRHEGVKEKYRELAIQAVTAEDPDLEEKMDATELEARIYQIVSGLPEQCRRIYTMSRVENKRNREIAEALNLSVRTVEAQISNALKTLKNNLLPLRQ